MLGLKLSVVYNSTWLFIWIFWQSDNFSSFSLHFGRLWMQLVRRESFILLSLVLLNGVIFPVFQEAAVILQGVFLPRFSCSRDAWNVGCECTVHDCCSLLNGNFLFLVRLYCRQIFVLFSLLKPLILTFFLNCIYYAFLVLCFTMSSEWRWYWLFGNVHFAPFCSLNVLLLLIAVFVNFHT